MPEAETDSRRTWAATLSFLSDDIIESFGPLLRRVALVLGEGTVDHEGDAEPNGYGGISRRGPLDRLLLSEWLYATEEPDEFMRRYVMAELSYLESQRLEPAGKSRLEVVLDNGPDVVGAGRLTHLLVLTVLSHRATKLGIPLAIGLIGTTPGTFVEGTLAELFPMWLNARSDQGIGSGIPESHLSEWWTTGAPNAQRWLLTSHVAEVAGEPLPPDVQVLRTHTMSWHENGGVMVTATIGGRSVELDFSDPTQAIRVLRGHGLKHRPIRSLSDDSPPWKKIRFPRFTSSQKRLLARGEQPNELVAINADEKGITKQFRFEGPVVAAGLVGFRVVGAVVRGNNLQVQIFGKKLGSTDLIRIPLDLLPFDPTHPMEDGLPLLLFCKGKMLVQIDSQWFCLHNEHVDAETALAIASGTTPDQPRKAFHLSEALYVGDQKIDIGQHPPTQLWLGADQTVAIFDGRQWEILYRSQRSTINVDPDELVLGVTAIEGVPSLVTRSSMGRLIRLRSAATVKTIMTASDEIIDWSLHPTEPLLAVQHEAGRIDIIELTTTQLLAEVALREHRD